ncbi:MAG: tripartite tricarboxylate transporter permease, partial [Pseudomonadota bacterium]
MLDVLQQALALFATWQNVVALGIGVVVGTFVGAIPGMTTPMAVALTLPFTFTLPPVTGILLLLGVYKGGIYGGSITAILINAPGTPAASCTVLDGYPLAKRGEARRALDIALYASCVADFFAEASSEVAYRVGFAYVRQLALKVRTALAQPAKSELLTWKFVHACRCWVATLGRNLD